MLHGWVDLRYIRLREREWLPGLGKEGLPILGINFRNTPMEGLTALKWGVQRISGLMMITTVDILLNGSKQEIENNFLEEFLEKASQLTFNDPPILANDNLDYILQIIKENEYIDLVIISDLTFGEETVKNIFINIGVDNDGVEVLLFFDLLELKKDPRTALHIIKSWCASFADTYNCHSYVCQIDNGDEDEYYFNEKGWGHCLMILVNDKKD
jgi:hypothetical protein